MNNRWKLVFIGRRSPAGFIDMCQLKPGHYVARHDGQMIAGGMMQDDGTTQFYDNFHRDKIIAIVPTHDVTLNTYLVIKHQRPGDGYSGE